MANRSEFGVEQRERLSATEFTEEYVNQAKAVLVKNALDGCAALDRWDLDYLRKKAGEKIVQLKRLDEANIRTEIKRLADYVDELQAYEAQFISGSAPNNCTPAYLHDVPLTSIMSDLDLELERFPSNYFPAWYRKDWARFAQLFLGPRDSLTPLHFDCLLTHNLFFQIRGRKRFILIEGAELKNCYPHHWRWCGVNVEQPDFDRHPRYLGVRQTVIVVEPGDALYFPPGTLHHVRSLDCALSFNVDWHTKGSALRGALAIARGMPIANVYYNCVVALGLWCGVSTARLFPFYRSYLNYVS